MIAIVLLLGAVVWFVSAPLGRGRATRSLAREEGRRADLEAVGLFDERYFLYTEDVDLCAGFRARGRRVIFVPGGASI